MVPQNLLGILDATGGGIHRISSVSVADQVFDLLLRLLACDSIDVGAVRLPGQRRLDRLQRTALGAPRLEPPFKIGESPLPRRFTNYLATPSRDQRLRLGGVGPCSFLSRL